MPNNIQTGRRGRPSREVVYERLQTQIGELRDKLGGLPTPLEAEGIWRGNWLEEAHNSTAIEGNTLARKQVEALLDEGRAVGNKELREYLEVRGYASAADWVYGQGIEPGDWRDGDLISLAEVRRIHTLAMVPVWDVAPHPQATDREGPGSFREHDIEEFPGGMGPPAWPEVPARMRDWVSAAQVLREVDEKAVAEHLAVLHANFEQIHPSSTEMDVPAAWFRTCCWFAWGSRPQSSTPATGRVTWLRSAERIRAILVLWASFWRAPYSTTSTSSSCLQ